MFVEDCIDALYKFCCTDCTFLRSLRVFGLDTWNSLLGASNIQFDILLLYATSHVLLHRYGMQVPEELGN